MLALVDTVPTSCVFVCDAFYDTLYLVYRGTPPADPSVDTAYREVHLWISVPSRRRPE